MERKEQCSVRVPVGDQHTDGFSVGAIDPGSREGKLIYSVTSETHTHTHTHTYIHTHVKAMGSCLPRASSLGCL